VPGADFETFKFDLMSEIKYGLISKTDANVLENTIDLICDSFPGEVVNVTEVGLYSGQTSEALSKYIALVKHRVFFYTGVDNGKDGEELKHFPPFNSRLILGNSNEVYNQIEDNSQHLVIIDANHSFPMVISDWYCYSRKVKKGGFVAMHDTAPQAQGKDWQRMGSEEDTDMYISVRKALNLMGLLPETKRYQVHSIISRFEWDLIFDEYDPLNEAGGICIFKKIN